MRIKCLTVGENKTNCYLVIFEDDSAYLVDPGAEGKKIFITIRKMGIRVMNILLTHGHFDHLEGLIYLRNKLEVELCIHSQDSEYLLDPERNLSHFMGRPISLEPAELFLDKVKIKSFKVIHTPGHTPGSVCFYNEERGILLSGDTIFKQGVGNTDFPGSCQLSLINAIQEKLLILPDKVVVYPGHGPSTTIKEFKKYFAKLSS